MRTVHARGTSSSARQAASRSSRSAAASACAADAPPAPHAHADAAARSPGVWPAALRASASAPAAISACSASLPRGAQSQNQARDWIWQGARPRVPRADSKQRLQRMLIARRPGSQRLALKPVSLWVSMQSATYT